MLACAEAFPICLEVLLVSIFYFAGVGLMTRPLWKCPLKPWPIAVDRMASCSDASYLCAAPLMGVILTTETCYMAYGDCAVKLSR